MTPFLSPIDQYGSPIARAVFESIERMKKDGVTRDEGAKVLIASLASVADQIEVGIPGFKARLIRFLCTPTGVPKL